MKTVRIAKIAGEFNLKISTIVEFLESKGYTIDPVPGAKLSAEQYRIISLEFNNDEKLSIEKTSQVLNAKMDSLIEFLQAQGIPINSSYLPSDCISIEEFKMLEDKFKIGLKFKDEQLSNYFNLDISNEDLYSIGEVEDGIHGIEKIDGEYYASIYHIQKFISKGELKNFLANFNGTKGLSELARYLHNKYQFDSVSVKYKNQEFVIKKYPYSAILNFFLESRSIGEEELETQIESESTIGLCELDAKFYRRFERLNPISLGKINFFVGQNNAGKSTVVEMLRLMIAYLKRSDHNIIDLKGINYGRILNKIESGVNVGEVGLAGKFDDCSFHFKFIGQKNKSLASVIRVKINNPFFTMLIDFSGSDIQVKMNVKEDDILSDAIVSIEKTKSIQASINEIERELSESNLPISRKLELNDNKNKLEKDLKKVLKLTAKSKNNKTENPTELIFEINRENLINLHILNIFNEVLDENESLLKAKKESGAIEAARKSLELKKYDFEKYLKDIFNRINLTDLHYLEGTSIKLSAVLKTGDNQDGLLNSIQYLKQSGVFDNENHRILAFIRKWLNFDKGFQIADDIRIRDFENEVFTIELLDKDGRWSHLGDSGLGAQRLFELIIGIARIVHHYELNKTAFKPIILVEEPEAHIHPALQSKLADFLYNINKEYDLRFIVETHSEYIVRKTQSIIKIENDTTRWVNPFNVIYFDKEKGPYTMEYRKDGKFITEFGPGFYDESSNLIFDLL